MNYYKAFNKDMTCRGFQYEVGKTYTLDGELELCENGFHFCDILNDCYNYYPDNDDTIICLVEPLGNVVRSKYKNKLATNKIKIVRQLSKEEIEQDKFLVQYGIEKIGNYTFNHCKSLTNITIPNSVTSIGEYAFYDCESLKKIFIPDSVTSIGSGAFYECKSLKSINIPNSVNFIGIENFNKCVSLKSATISNNITHISWYTFNNCKSLKSVIIPDSVICIAGNAFDNCPLLTIYGYKNSYAEEYAKENNIKFEEIGDYEWK